MQTVIRPSDFGYCVEDFINAVPELGLSFNSLAAAGADVAVQFGYPFSLVHGWEKARQVQQNIQGSSKTGFVMMGVEAVHALRYLKCKSVAIASTYYSEKMSKILYAYLMEAGLNVVNSGNRQPQDMVEEKNSGLFVGEGESDPMNWKNPSYAVEEAVRHASKNNPDADCILVSGGGNRLLDIVDGLEKEVNKPVVGGDITLYWGILRRLGIKKGVEGHGRLLAGLT
ncbi:MAG: hypothetical protein ACOWWR_12240 [Eubacteriales bacterium]